MDPKTHSDWVSRRQAKVYDTIASGGVFAPALVERQLIEELPPRHFGAAARPPLGRYPGPWFQRLETWWHCCRHGHRSEKSGPGLPQPHAEAFAATRGRSPEAEPEAEPEALIPERPSPRRISVGTRGTISGCAERAMIPANDARFSEEGTMTDIEDPPTQHRHSVVLGPGAGRTIALGPAATVTMKAQAAESGGTLSAYEAVLPPATAGPPSHLHRTWDEAFYVLEGEMTFLIDGREHRAPAGSFVFVPRGILHTFWNASDASAKQLTVFTPAGIEDYFDAVTQVLADGGEEALDAVEALMASHDMIVPADARPAYGALTPADHVEI